MSYILEALRRADAARERGRVPGLHSRTEGPQAAASPKQRRTGLLPVLVGGALLIAALAALLVQRPGAPAPRPEPAAQTPNLGTVSAEAAPPAQPDRLVVAPTPARPSAVAAPAPVRRVSPAGPVAGANRPSAAGLPAKAETSIVAPTRPGQPSAAADPHDDLPAALRRELPKLVVSGSVYSEEAANRFLIVNGEVVHEGDQLGPELSVEQIGPKTAWLRFRTYRVKLPL